MISYPMPQRIGYHVVIKSPYFFGREGTKAIFLRGIRSLYETSPDFLNKKQPHPQKQSIRIPKKILTSSDVLGISIPNSICNLILLKAQALELQHNSQ